MTVIADLLVRVSASIDGLKQGLSQANDDLNGASKTWARVGDSMTSIGGKLTAGVTLPLAAAAAVGVSAASDLEESANKVRVVFGDSADAILGWSKNAATGFGQSQQQALEAAGTFGNLFVSMGMDTKQAGKMSTELVELAGDLASFNNISPAEALEKLRAGLVGESEPLRTVGVQLDEASVKARALAMGLAKSEKELTAADKATARYAIILEQTKTAQGDFKRTSDGLANSQRIVAAQLVNAAAVLGAQLMPIVTQVVGVISGLIEKFTALPTPIQNGIVVIGALAAALGPLLMVMGTVATVIGAIGAPILAIAAVVAVLAAAWINNWGGIRDTLTGVWEGTLKPALQQIWQWLSTNIPAAIQTVSAFWTNTLLPALQQVWAFIQTNLIPLFQAIGNVLSAVVGTAVTALAGLWQNVLQPALMAVWTWMQANLLPIWQALADKLSGPVQTALTIAKTLFEALHTAISGIGTAIQNATSWLNDLATKIRTIKLPDWLTPGSPTPFELGLIGIGNALAQLAQTALPQFQAALGINAPNLPGLGVAGAGAGGGYGQTQINVTVAAGAVVVTTDNPDTVAGGLVDAIFRALTNAGERITMPAPALVPGAR